MTERGSAGRRPPLFPDPFLAAMERGMNAAEAQALAALDEALKHPRKEFLIELRKRGLYVRKVKLPNGSKGMWIPKTKANAA